MILRFRSYLVSVPSDLLGFRQSKLKSVVGKKTFSLKNVSQLTARLLNSAAVNYVIFSKHDVV